MLDPDSSGYLGTALVLSLEGGGFVFDDDPAPTHEGLADNFVDLFRFIYGDIEGWREERLLRAGVDYDAYEKK
jgi:hypothetical protein